MTDLSVLLPDSTSREDADRFCELLSSALSRIQPSTDRTAGPLSVEVMGVERSSDGRPPTSLTDESSGWVANLLAALQATTGQFVVWMPHPGRPDAADEVVDLFARRRELPFFSEPRLDGELPVRNDDRAHTSGTRLQTELQTLVDSQLRSCLVLRNRIHTLRSEASPNPWNDRRGQSRQSHTGRNSGMISQASSSAWRADHCPLKARELSGGQIESDQKHSTSRPVIRARSIVLAAVVVGAAWFFWGGGSSMIAATDPAASSPARSESSSGDSTSDTASTAAARLLAFRTSVDGDQPAADSATGSNDTSAVRSQSESANPRQRPAGEDRGQKPDSVDSSDASHGSLDTSADAVEERIRRDATLLASDELEGRGVRTRGLDQAAEYLARQFADAGLNTAHYNETPFQEFELLSVGGESPVQQIEFRGPDHPARQLVPDRDFASLLLSRSTKLDVPVAFAGYGISAPEVGYDDYQGLDVAGKAVVILRHAPTEFETAADDLAGHSYVRTKIAAASARGASAVLLCSDLVSLETSEAAARGDQLLRVELTLDDGIRPLPVIHCRRDILKELLNDFCSFDLDTVERGIAQASKPNSQLLEGLTLAGHVSQLRRGRTLKNVVATLEPSAPVSDETIILGAHYDHLGRGGWGSLTLGANEEIHNGADDNASGTSVMLEVARQLAAAETPLDRRVLFIGFSAEELGLIGSRKYVREPLIPLNQSIAMLNLDMVGRLRNNRLTVYGTGSSKQWPPLLETLAPRRDLTIISKPSGYGPSDHASFYEAGIPVLHFFTGFHPQYHRPEDDVEHLNVEGMRRIASLIVDLVTALAQTEERPPRSLAGAGSGLSALPLGIDGLVPSTARPARPTLGIVPANRIAGRGGVLVGQTIAQSLADQYGIRTGDVIVRIGENRIDSVDELVSKVRSQSEGSKLPIELVRNGIRMEVRVQF